MDNVSLSVLFGLFFTALFFLIPFFSVAIVRIVMLFFKNKSKPEKPATPKKRKPIKSIEINPEEVDRIYVKKLN